MLRARRPRHPGANVRESDPALLLGAPALQANRRAMPNAIRERGGCRFRTAGRHTRCSGARRRSAHSLAAWRGHPGNRGDRAGTAAGATRRPGRSPTSSTTGARRPDRGRSAGVATPVGPNAATGTAPSGSAAGRCRCACARRRQPRRRWRRGRRAAGGPAAGPCVPPGAPPRWPKMPPPSPVRNGGFAHLCALARRHRDGVSLRSRPSRRSRPSAGRARPWS